MIRIVAYTKQIPVNDKITSQGHAGGLINPNVSLHDKQERKAEGVRHLLTMSHIATSVIALR
jgi:hypothetical protein